MLKVINLVLDLFNIEFRLLNQVFMCLRSSYCITRHFLRRRTFNYIISAVVSSAYEKIEPLRDRVN